MKKILVISETIFSDRLFKTLGLQSSTRYEASIIDSNKLNDIEKEYLISINQNKLQSSQFKIIKFLRTIHRYVSPLNTQRMSLDDHYDIDSKEWNFTKKALIRIVVNLFIFLW